WYAYDSLTLTGEVTGIDDDGLVTLKIVGTDSLGAHVTSTATLYLNGDPQ
ncbi:MAG: beta-hydroxyacyl-ACP dehydratase, partial [Dietzia cercidiphylli]